MKIKFIPGSPEIGNSVECPIPSKNFIPEWYKNINPKNSISGIKRCMPFFDSLTSGYIQATWGNIFVESENDKIAFYSDSSVPLFSSRETDVKTKEEFYNIEFTWQRPWSAFLPEGYSILITHPLNRMDLPFYTMSGIVDADKAIHTSVGNIPFFIKNGFIGIIPKGTPMFQIIPIKRETWNLEKSSYSKEFWDKKQEERNNELDYYKKKFWTKKSFS